MIAKNATETHCQEKSCVQCFPCSNRRNASKPQRNGLKDAKELGEGSCQVSHLSAAFRAKTPEGGCLRWIQKSFGKTKLFFNFYALEHSLYAVESVKPWIEPMPNKSLKPKDI